VSNGIFPFVLWTPTMPNLSLRTTVTGGGYFSRLFHSSESKSVCMLVITPEGLFMKFCITGCLGSLLRQFRFYWNEIILTTTWREILLTQHDVLLGGICTCTCVAYSSCVRRKNCHVLAQIIHVALDCTGSTWLPFMAHGPSDSDMSWCLRWKRKVARHVRGWIQNKGARLNTLCLHFLVYLKFILVRECTAFWKV
jgi:hypothetical protein